MATISSNSSFKHLAVIMDGNGRWAKKRLLPRKAGHNAGAKAVRLLIENAVKANVEVLTLFAFSSENWQRPQSEVHNLLNLFFKHLEEELPSFQEHNIKLKIIGDRQRFSDDLMTRINDSEQATASNTGLVLVIAASYGGHWDLTQAVKSISQDIKNKVIACDDIDELLLQKHVALAEYPSPDLLIRTGGQKRLSNFMLWQLAYAELYFIDTLWPDFSTDDFIQAMDYFDSCQRRFGKVNDQLQDVGE